MVGIFILFILEQMKCEGIALVMVKLESQFTCRI